MRGQRVVMAFYLEKSLCPLHEEASPLFPSPDGGGRGRSEQRESWQGVAGARPASRNVMWAKVTEYF